MATALINLSGSERLPRLLGRPLHEVQRRGLTRAGYDRLIEWREDTDVAKLLAALPERGAVTLVDPAVLLDDALLSRLAGLPTPLILSVDNVNGSEAFELMDARTRWSGWAVVDVGLVRTALGNLGEWDLFSTVLRVALQTGVPQLRLEAERVRRVDDEHEARALGERLVTQVELAGGWGERKLSDGAARRLALLALRHGVEVRVPWWISLALAISSPVAAGLQHFVLAAVALVLAAVAEQTARRLAAPFGEGAGLPLPRASQGCAALALLVGSIWLYHSSGQWGIGLLAAGIGGVRFIVPKQQRSQAPDVPMLALLLGTAAALGLPTAGLALAAALNLVWLVREVRRLD